MNTELAARRLQELEADAPDALRLARLASLAVRVERHLLRCLRIKLLSGVDVGAEADLWFSSIVESRGSSSFVIDAAAALLLRRDLARDPATFERAVAITAEEHRYLSESIRLEEQLNAITARSGDEVMARIDEALQPALRALREGGARAKGVARWAMRALPRLDPVVRESGNALALLLGASAALGGRRIVRDRAATRTPLDLVAWAIPPSSIPKAVSVGLEMSSAALTFVENDGSGPALELPGTTPRLLEVSWPADGSRVVQMVEAEAGNSVAVEPQVRAITLRTLDGREYLLEMSSSTDSPASTSSAPAKPVCYVVMGFGKKTDHATGRTFDLDRSYRVMIKPAAEAAGFDSIRADEIVHAGLIDAPPFEYLLNADVVLADLSTSNPSALYELGVRQALRPHATVLITEGGNRSLPTLLEHLRVYRYHHLGEGLDPEEVERFRSVLTEILISRLANVDVDSPVYQLMPGLQAPGGPRGKSNAQTATQSAAPARKVAPTPDGSAEAETGEQRPVCFVVMGLGKKTDYATGRTLDLDRSFRLMIRPAAEAAGLQCVRIDESASPATIDALTYEQLLTADVVIADLSTANPDALYQLGIRHALRPYTTLVIAEDQFRTPFPLSVPILTYRHLGDAIDHNEALRFRELLAGRLTASLASPQVDSPVYTFLPDLIPPSRARAEHRHGSR